MDDYEKIEPVLDATIGALRRERDAGHFTNDEIPRLVRHLTETLRAFWELAREEGREL